MGKTLADFPVNFVTPYITGKWVLNESNYTYEYQVKAPDGATYNLMGCDAEYYETTPKDMLEIDLSRLLVATVARDWERYGAGWKA